MCDFTHVHKYQMSPSVLSKAPEPIRLVRTAQCQIKNMTLQDRIHYIDRCSPC